MAGVPKGEFCLPESCLVCSKACYVFFVLCLEVCCVTLGHVWCAQMWILSPLWCAQTCIPSPLIIPGVLKGVFYLPWSCLVAQVHFFSCLVCSKVYSVSLDHVWCAVYVASCLVYLLSSVSPVWCGLRGVVSPLIMPVCSDVFSVSCLVCSVVNKNMCHL